MGCGLSISVLLFIHGYQIYLNIQILNLLRDILNVCLHSAPPTVFVWIRQTATACMHNTFLQP